MNEMPYKNNRRITKIIVILLIIIILAIGIVTTAVIHNSNNKENTNFSQKNNLDGICMLSLDNYTVEFNIPTEVETTSIQQEKWFTYTFCYEYHKLSFQYLHCLFLSLLCLRNSK